MYTLEEDLQEIIEQSRVELGSSGIIARVETDDFFWCGTSGILTSTDIDRGFYICSLSKTFTAIVVMKLLENGKLKLDDRISIYLNKISPFQNITIRQLLNHSHRIPDYTSFDNYEDEVNKSPHNPWSREYISSRAKKIGLLESSDGNWSYSNTGYMYLYQIIETVTGQSYVDAIDELVIKPLGFQYTYVATKIDKGKILIPAYDQYFSKYEGDIRCQYHPDWCATGVLVSNVKEVCYLYRKLLEGSILSEESMQEVLEGVETPYWVGGREALYNGKLSYGLGIRICRKFPLGPFFGHGGDCPGYSIWAGYIDISGGKNITSCVVCNSSLEFPPAEVWMKLINRVVE